jgi:hypothetical protein
MPQKLQWQPFLLPKYLELEHEPPERENTALLTEIK